MIEKNLKAVQIFVKKLLRSIFLMKELAATGYEHATFGKQSGLTIFFVQNRRARNTILRNYLNDVKNTDRSPGAALRLEEKFYEQQ